ncbi:MAG: DAK2 domain-containing protein [Tissierellia bacterium]|nr:DAK2 domain-containing protein [Tissierellia bacterium]
MDVVSAQNLALALNNAARYIEVKKELINELNVFPVPDGDTGTNMSMTVKSAVSQMNGASYETIGEVAKVAARGALMGARGNSGVILSQLFRGFADGLKEVEAATISDLAVAFKRASEMTYSAVMKPTEGTILTVGRETSDYAIRVAKKHSKVVTFLEDVLQQAKKSLDNTPKLLPVLREAGVVDAGGMGLVVLLEGALLTAQGKTLEEVSQGQDQSAKVYDYSLTATLVGDREGALAAVEDLEGRVSVEAASRGQKLTIESDALGAYFDLLLPLVGLEDIEITANNQAPQGESPQVAVEEKPLGVVAVTNGPGLEEIFKELGVDEIVTGGQTMNPPTEELLKAMDRVPSQNIIILPNNGNIKMTALAAQDVSKKNVVVLNTKTMPEGIQAVLHLQPEASLEENEATMTQAIGEVNTGQITYAVRDTTLGGKNIEKGDFIGINKKEIKSCGKKLPQVVRELIDEMKDENTTFVTLYRGEEVSQEEGDALLESLEGEFSDIDFEMVYGGQPTYFYLVSVE